MFNWIFDINIFASLRWPNERLPRRMRQQQREKESEREKKATKRTSDQTNNGQTFWYFPFRSIYFEMFFFSPFVFFGLVRHHHTIHRLNCTTKYTNVFIDNWQCHVFEKNKWWKKISSFFFFFGLHYLSIFFLSVLPIYVWQAMLFHVSVLLSLSLPLVSVSALQATLKVVIQPIVVLCVHIWIIYIYRNAHMSYLTTFQKLLTRSSFRIRTQNSFTVITSNLFAFFV